MTYSLFAYNPLKLGLNTAICMVTRPYSAAIWEDICYIWPSPRERARPGARGLRLQSQSYPDLLEPVQWSDDDPYLR